MNLNVHFYIWSVKPCIVKKMFVFKVTLVVMYADAEPDDEFLNFCVELMCCCDVGYIDSKIFPAYAR